MNLDKSQNLNDSPDGVDEQSKGEAGEIAEKSGKKIGTIRAGSQPGGDQKV